MRWFLIYYAKLYSKVSASKVKSLGGSVESHGGVGILDLQAYFPYFCLQMKVVARIGYWLVGLSLVSAILVSLNYTLTQAVLISLVFLPCVLALEYFLPKADSFLNKLWLCLAVLVVAVLLVLVIHRLLWSPFMKGEVWRMLDVQPILVNPAFLGLIVTALAVGDYGWHKWLDKKLPSAPRQITFFSDRKTVTLPLDEIAFIESNDTEVRIVTKEGRSFRNRTGISQWENILGEGFVRIHRSYLVNRSCITSVGTDSLVASSTTLPISRKYRKTVMSVVGG